MIYFKNGSYILFTIELNDDEIVEDSNINDNSDGDNDNTDIDSDSGFVVGSLGT